MGIDRDIQRRILEGLSRVYPSGIYEPIRDLELTDISEEDMLANVQYLDEHGLVSSGYARTDFVGGDIAWHNSARTNITAAGLDFLADDGGLSAILGVVTIKLHDSDLKSLIEAHIQRSELSPPDKKQWLDQLRSLPADATKQVALELVKQGLAHWPDAVHAIGKLLGLG